MNALDIKTKEWLDLRSFVGDAQLFEKLGSNDLSYNINLN